MAEDISLDFKLSKKRKQQLAIIALVLIPIFLAFFFRAYTDDLPITDQWAESSIENQIKNNLANQIQQQFPNLPSSSLQGQVNEQYERVMEEQGDQIRAQTAAISQQFKNQLKNEQGETYLLAIDPWFYLQNAENLIENGHHGDGLKEGEPYNTLQLAPEGRTPDSNWHSNMMVLFYTLLGSFGLSLMGAAFWIPAVFAALATIPAFFIARRKAGNLGGFIAASILAVHTAFLSRTPAGFSDTDAYNIFFPLLAVWLFLEAFEAKNIYKKVGLAGLSGLSLGIFSKFWIGYWYILDIIIVATIGYIGFVVVRHLYLNYQRKLEKKKVTSWKPVLDALKGTAIVFGSFYIITTIISGFLIGLERALTAPLEAFSITRLNVATNPTLWPNVLTTVAELGDVSFSQIVQQMGGKLLFVLALIGASFAILPKKLTNRDYLYITISVLISLFLISSTALAFSPFTYLVILGIPLAIGVFFLIADNREVDIKYGVLMLVWFIAAMYTTTQGVRFTLVLVPPLAILIGTFAGLAQKHLSVYLQKELELSKKIVIPVITIFMLLILIAPIQSAHETALSQVPSMNDAWYESLTDIRDNSDSDAIITSWWDFGHWFRSISDRGVTFDGATQNTPMAHWVGKMLLSTNENESLGIQRMLNCGSRTGFDRLNEKVGDTLQSKNLMDEIILLDREAAAARLTEEGIDANYVLERTHCEPPESFLITSQDMVGKAGVWGHFGLWDFEKSYIYNNRQTPTSELVADMTSRGMTESRASTLVSEAKNLASEEAANSWIAPWPSYSDGWISCNEQTGEVNTTAMGTNTTPEGSLVERELVVCPAQINLGQTSQGNVVIEAIIVDKEDPETTRYRYGFYQGNSRTQSADVGRPGTMFIAHNTTMERVDFDGETSGTGLLYDKVNSRVLLADEAHVGSLFTQLFYLDGRTVNNFEKFSDETSFNGQRIIVWKAQWD